MPFVIFGIIRIGVGASIFGTLDKVKLGAWWVGVVMFITAFTQFRIYSRLVTTLISIIIALAGAINPELRKCSYEHNNSNPPCS